MQKIIVTADDYGMCNVVDKAIDAGIENGFITTTNVMVNMDSLINAGTLRQRYPFISIGIHWNVTTGRPVCNPSSVPTLVDNHGQFWPIVEFKRRYSKGLISSRDLREELEKQYIIFEKYCGKPDYWNTHENSSLHLKAFGIFAEVAKLHGIDATRTFQRVYYDKIDLGVRQSFREFLVKNFFQWWFSRIRRDFRMPAARIVSFGKISKTEGDVLLHALLRDGRDFIEIVFHPATSGNHLYFGNISDERLKEYKFVCSESVKQRFVEHGFVFTNFQDL